MGCDHRCTFCIIPYGRGPSRFIPEGRVIDQVQTFVQQGYSEIVLTGVNITSWGMDCEEKKSLGDLVQKILHAVPDLQRLRLSSVDCAEIDCCLLDTMKYEPRLLPYFHFSLQSGDNMILKRMKRRHSREEALLVCAELLAHRKDAVFGADIITGFPTETEEHFQNSLALVSECHLTFLHVFPYSPRQGTPAARMPQVSRSLAKERAERLRDAGQRNKEIWLGNQIGKMAKILVERNGTGRTETFAEVVFAEKKESGSIVNTKILAADSQYLYA
jgi:threonylcarbamoyladenosine tRNA methylthiotransferase MtaB